MEERESHFFFWFVAWWGSEDVKRMNITEVLSAADVPDEQGSRTLTEPSKPETVLPKS